MKISLYYLFIGLGAIAAIASFAYKQKNDAQRTKLAIICIVSTILSLLFSYGISHIIHKNFADSAHIFGLEYYITMIIFVSSSFSLGSFCNIKGPYKQAIMQSLVIFSFIARYSCLFAHCCQGKTYFGFQIPIAILEIIFALISFIALNKFRAESYLLGYSIFRFITEFFRQNEDMRLIFGLNFRQYLAIVVIIIVVLAFFTEGKGRNCDKNS